VHRDWDFGDLPESVVTESARLKLVQYPAIEDRVDGVAIIEVRSVLDAAAITRAGLGRLASLALPQLARNLRRRYAEDRELVLRAHGVPVGRALPEALTDRTFRECFFPAHLPLPHRRADFVARLAERRAELDETADALSRLIGRILGAAREIRQRLESLGSAAFEPARIEARAQLDALLQPRFLDAIPEPWLAQYPRYLAAIGRRLERLRGNVAAQLRPFSQALDALDAGTAARAARPEIERLRWMIEEYRVSLFAQELGTVTRVSDKRLTEQLAAARAEARG
jgi:ATP-dependent helicase HrpA